MLCLKAQYPQKIKREIKLEIYKFYQRKNKKTDLTNNYFLERG